MSSTRKRSSSTLLRRTGRPPVEVFQASTMSLRRRNSGSMMGEASSRAATVGVRASALVPTGTKLRAMLVIVSCVAS